MTKRFEHIGKNILRGIVKLFLPSPVPEILSLEEIRKVLIFRLDQRLGNGIMLYPLIRAIRQSLPEAEIHLLIHAPIAQFFEQTISSQVNKIWAYNQPYLLHNPFRLLKLLNQLKSEEFDVIFSCHNPDNFSLSQALFGRWLKPRRLVGFKWKDSKSFYDIAVESHTDKHYTDAMLDLWRVFDPTARLKWGGIQIPSSIWKQILNQYPQLKDRPVLIWLGATSGKQLPVSLITFIFQLLRDNFQMPVIFALGPADKDQRRHFPSWIRHQIVVLENALIETAAFISHCRWFISGDTGPMHLAVAIDVPTLTIFTYTNLVQYGYDDGDKHLAFQYEQSPHNLEKLKQLIYQTVFRLHLDEANVE